MNRRLFFPFNNLLVLKFFLFTLLFSSLSIVTWGQTLQPSGSSASLCENDTIRVISAPNGSTFQWTRNGNNISGATNAFLVVTQSGNYGCIVTSGGTPTTLGPINITVQTPPNVTFTPANPTVCPGGSVVITAAGATSYSWSPTTNITPTTGASVTVTPSNNTTYTVTATQGVCTVAEPITVAIRPQPTASFNWGPQPPACLNRRRTVRFTSTSQSNGAGSLSYSWNFGDPNSGSNNTSTQANPQHSFVGAGFTTSGTFTVTLTVTAANGCSSTFSQNVFVQSFPDARLNSSATIRTFNGEPYFAACGNNAGATINFFNASTTEATNTEYFVDWGDGSPTLSQSTFSTGIPHLYNVGTYQLTHVVSNGTCRDTSYYRVFVGSNPAVGLGNPGNTSICTNSSLVFPINNTGNNPPGTIYTVSFNDNTAPITFSHPPPPSVSHLFNTTSCGVSSTSGTIPYNNSFSASIVAANPCQTSASTVVPIYVSDRPDANFTILPRDTFCVNTIATIRNTSNEGNLADANQTLGECGQSKRVWRISPSTGWVLVSGSLGNDFNSTSPNPWNSGTDSIRVNFTTPGQYSIRLAVGSGDLCGIDTIVKRICVNPTPTADFTLTKTSLCVNDSVSAIGTTNTPLCGTNTFNWTVGYQAIPGCGPATPSYTLLNGTTLQSPTLQIRYNNPGIYIIRLQTIAPLASCSSAIVEKRDTVKAKPNIILTLPQNSICVGQSITPVLRDSCFVTNATYQWTISGGTSTSSLTSAIPPTINYNTAGNFTITISVTNECGTTTVSQNITVNPTPTISPTPDRTECAGTTIPATTISTTPTGATISWTNSNTGIGLAASGNGNIPAFVSTNTTNGSITGTIIVRANLNGCLATPDTFLITVLPTPQISAVANQTVCAGASTAPINFTGSAVAGTVYNWTNSNTAIGLAASGTGSIPAFTATNTTTGPITATLIVTPVVSGGTSNCPGISRTFTITVNPVPTALAPANREICNGSSSTAIALSGSIPSATYNWSTTGAIGLTPTSGTGTIPAFTAINNGTSPITAQFAIVPSFTANSLTCNGPTANFAITVNPAPAVSFSIPPQRICSGSTTSLVNLTSNIANTSISWTAAIPAGISGATSNGTNQIPAETLVNTTNTPLTITYTVNASTSAGLSCAGTAQTYTIVVNPIPNITASPSSGTICSGARFISTLSSNVANTTFSWTVNAPSSISGASSGSSNSINQLLINNSNTTQTVVYTVTPTFSNAGISCPGTPIDITVTVHPKPVVSLNPRFEQICSGGTSAAVTPNTPVANTNINWTATSSLGNLTGFTSTGTGSIPAFTLVNSGNTIDTLTITLTPTANNCPGDTVQYRILVIPEARITNTPLQQVVCSGAPSVLVNWTSNVAGATFTWTAVASSPSVTGFLSSGSGNLPAFTLTNSGSTTETVTITVTPSRAGCSGIEATYTISVNPNPTVNAIANQTVCTNTNTTAITFNSPVAGTTYAWTTNASIGLTPPNGTGNIPAFVAVNNGVNPINALFTVTPTITLNGTTCNGPNSTFTITVNPSPTVVFSIPDQTICSGATSAPVNLTSTTTGANISWTATIPTNITGAATNGTNNIPAQILINNGVVPDTIIYTAIAATSGATTCAGVNGTYRIIVNPVPTIDAVSNQVVCNGVSATSITFSGSVPGTIYSWSSTGNIGLNPTSGTASIPAFVGVNNGTIPLIGNFTVTPRYTSGITTCTGPITSFTITVDPAPVVSFSLPPQTVCSGSTSNLVSLSSSLTNTNIDWTATIPAGITGGTPTGSNQIPAQTLINSTNAPLTITYTINAATSSGNSCSGTAQSYTITVNPRPSVSAMPATAAQCSNVSFNTSLSSNIAGTTFTWSVNTPAEISGGASGNGSSINQTLVNSSITDQTVVYTVTPTFSNAGISCPGTPIDITVTVHPIPVVNLNPRFEQICSGGTSVPVTPNTPVANTNINWTATSSLGNLTGFTSTGTGSIPAFTLVNSGNTIDTLTITLTPTANNCPGDTVQYRILVIPEARITNTPLQQVVCSGTPSAPVNWASNVAGATFTWTAVASSSNVTGFLSSGSGNLPAFTLTNSGSTTETVTITVTPSRAGCSGIEATYTISVNPNPTVNAIANQTVCTNTNTTAIAFSSPVAGTTYAWTTNASIGLTPPNGTGNIPAFVAVNNGVNPINALFTITPTITLNGTTCNGPNSTFTITVNPSPTVVFSIPDQTICSGATSAPVNLTSTTTGANISWTATIPTNITGAATNGTNNIPAQILINNGVVPLSIIYEASATTIGAAACAGSIAAYTITVNPQPNVLATPNTDTICSGSATNIALTSNVPGTTFEWTITAPSSITGAQIGNGDQINQNLVNNSALPQIVVYRVTPSFLNNGIVCLGSSIDVPIVINPSPSINNSSLSQALCTNTQTQPVTFSSGSPGVSYTWSITANNGVSGALPNGQGSIPVMTVQNSGLVNATVTYTIVPAVDVCPGSPINYTFTVWPNARALFTFATDSACAPFALSIQNQGPATANGSYQWLANNTVIGTSEAFPGYTINNSDDSIRITLIALSPNGCRPDTMHRMFYTLPIPVPSFTRTPIDTCGPVTVQFTNTTPRQPEFQFLWDFGNGQTSTSAVPPAITYLPNPGFRDTTYRIRLFAFNRCDTIIALDSVIVRTKPRARFGVQTTTGCSPFTVQIANTSLGTGNVYYWDFGDGNRDTTFTLANVQHTYFVAQTDTFDIRLIAVNQCGADTLIIPIRVAPNTIRPIINVAAPGLFGCAPHTVTFLNNSIGATQYTWDFGDGTAPQQTTDTLTAITHIFTNPGTFNVSVLLTNGCSDTTANFTITVLGLPNASFNITSPVCVNDTVRIQNTTTQANSFRWFWGDGNQSVGPNPTHVYTSPGSYTVILRAEQTATSGIVCSDTVQRNIIVHPKPDLLLQTNIPSIACTPYTFQGSLPNITNETVQWIINDTSRTPAITTLNGSSASYTFQNPGTYRITIRASNSMGCSDSTILTVVVRGRPRALIAPSAITTCSTDTTIVFTNNSQSTDGFGLTYVWQVNGNNVGTNASFSNRFILPPNVPMPFVFTTRLIARNNVGCTDTAVSTLRMVPTSDASFAIQNPNDCVPFALSIQQGSQHADRYRWLVNGVQVDTARIPNIILTAPATTYRIELITSNVFGCRPDTAFTIITTRQRPRAAFTLRDTLGCTGNLNVITTNTSQFANTYSWSWGDGTTGSALVSPTHLYNTVGQYQITLIASDGVCRDTTSRIVRVSNKPVVNFTVDVPVSCDTARVQLTNLTTNADTYLWTFSNGFQSTLMNPQYSFPPSASLYTIKLVASNAAGCRDSLTRSNIVQAIIPPVAGFVILPSPVISIPNYTFNFQSTSLDRTTYRYIWDLGDGSNATSRNVTHLYPDTGTYRVQQILLDTQTGCADTVARLVTIQGQPGHLYVPNAFYPNSIQDQFRFFRPLGKGLATYHFQVFDSWGKLLFESKALDAAGSPTEGWDGTFKGQPMPQDGYAWRIQAVFRNGRKWEGMSYNNNQSGAPAHTFGTVTLFR